MNKNKYKTICLIILSCYIFMGCSWSKYEIDNNEKYEEKRDTEAGITEDTKITQESEEKYQDYISAKKKDEIEIDSESLELYEAFISGNALLNSLIFLSAILLLSQKPSNKQSSSLFK